MHDKSLKVNLKTTKNWFTMLEKINDNFKFTYRDFIKEPFNSVLDDKSQTAVNFVKGLKQVSPRSK